MAFIIALIGSCSFTISATTLLPTKGTIFVKQNSSGLADGSSWLNATDDLQSAIDCSGVQQVWVAQGTYRPTKLMTVNSVFSSDPRLASFILVENVDIIGGFEGSETSTESRQVEDINADGAIASWEFKYPTVLDGDLGTLGDKTDNSYHVIFQPTQFYSETSIDGFTVRNGFAGGNLQIAFSVLYPEHYQGAGIYSSSKCDIKNCIIERNQSTSTGSGINVQDGTIEKCIIRYNYSEASGSLYSIKSNIISCSVAENHVDGSGGGIDAYNSNISNCLVRNNEAGAYGGGVNFNNDGSSLKYGTISNTTISSNESNLSGGGLFINSGLASNILVSANSCSGFGGGIRMLSGKVIDSEIHSNYGQEGGGVSIRTASSYLERCKIYNNTSTLYGGGIFVTENGNIVNCLISNNTCEGDAGGGIWSDESTIFNCTVTNNIVQDGSTGGISASNGTVANSIVYGNLPDEQFKAQFTRGSLCEVLSSGIQGEVYNLEGVILLSESASQYFSSACSFVGTANTLDELQDIKDADWSPIVGCCLIDAGTSSGAPSVDINSLSRTNTPDIGAYELGNALGMTSNREVYADFYPNPFSSIIYFNNANLSVIEITIYSITGSLLHTETVHNQINLSFLPSGTYIVKHSKNTQLIVKE